MEQLIAAGKVQVGDLFKGEFMAKFVTCTATVPGGGQVRLWFGDRAHKCDSNEMVQVRRAVPRQAQVPARDVNVGDWFKASTMETFALCSDFGQSGDSVDLWHDGDCLTCAAGELVWVRAPNTAPAPMATPDQQMIQAKQVKEGDWFKDSAMDKFELCTGFSAIGKVRLDYGASLHAWCEPGELVWVRVPSADPAPEKVHHPKHYNQHAMECIDVLRVQLTPAEFKGFCLGNMLKYRWRAGDKQGESADTDLEKAAWYENEIRKGAK